MDIMKTISKKDKRRFFIWTLLITVIVLYLSVFTFNYWNKILKNVQLKEELKIKYEQSLAEEKKLSSEVTKLQDPNYVAKYAREKFMYSKDGEIIIRITED
ncbi:MAG: septum formation initiator family protein [Bacilli bacterium]